VIEITDQTGCVWRGCRSTRLSDNAGRRDKDVFKQWPCFRRRPVRDVSRPSIPTPASTFHGRCDENAGDRGRVAGIKTEFLKREEREMTRRETQTTGTRRL